MSVFDGIITAIATLSLLIWVRGCFIKPARADYIAALSIAAFACGIYFYLFSATNVAYLGSGIFAVFLLALLPFVRLVRTPSLELKTKKEKMRQNSSLQSKLTETFPLAQVEVGVLGQEPGQEATPEAFQEAVTAALLRRITEERDEMIRRGWDPDHPTFECVPLAWGRVSVSTEGQAMAVIREIVNHYKGADVVMFPHLTPDLAVLYVELSLKLPGKVRCHAQPADPVVRLEARDPATGALCAWTIKITS